MPWSILLKYSFNLLLITANRCQDYREQQPCFIQLSVPAGINPAFAHRSLLGKTGPLVLLALTTTTPCSAASLSAFSASREIEPCPVPA